MAEAQADATGGSGNEQLIALLISFIIPGGGQLYQGRTKEGAAFLVGAVIATIVGLVLGLVVGALTFGLGLLILPFLYGIVWAVSLYDTYAEWLSL